MKDRVSTSMAGSIAGVFGAALLASSAMAQDITQERLVNSEREPQNWLNHHGNYEAHRFSGLSDINRDNVKDLRVAFTYAMGSVQGGGTDPVVFPFAGLEGTPIAEDGFLYLTTGWGVVTKVDVRGGKAATIWKSDPQADKDWAPSVLC
ncbi:MAG: PQQ-dependent dehydrogenase, methanol/ethanol family, partial [Geminicoccaceae bacterium]